MQTKLPDTFTHILQDRLFLEGMSGAPNYSIVGDEGNLGRRYTVWPLCIEYYTGDREPELRPFRGLRFVIWNPVTREDKLEGWFSFAKESKRIVSAYVDIRETATYHKSWSDTFKTYRNRFSSQTKYKVTEASCSLYCEKYALYAKKDISNTRNMEQAKRLTSKDKDATHFYFLEDRETHDILGGIAAVDCFSVDQSYYLSAFTRKDRAPKETGLWLLMYWMKESGTRGIALANLGIIWSEGDSEEWKGFSDFKMKFNPERIVLKRELMRFTFSL